MRRYDRAGTVCRSKWFCCTRRCVTCSRCPSFRSERDTPELLLRGHVCFSCVIVSGGNLLGDFRRKKLFWTSQGRVLACSTETLAEICQSLPANCAHPRPVCQQANIVLGKIPSAHAHRSPVRHADKPAGRRSVDECIGQDANQHADVDKERRGVPDLLRQ